MRMNGRGIATIGALALAGGLLAATFDSGAAPPAKPKRACEKCHKEAVADLASYGGAHAGFGCADCHGEAHPPKGEKKAPPCTGCHEGHGKEMVATDCARCHRAHRPLEVRYGVDVPSKQCGACHEGPLAAMEATKSRHKPLRCVLCHQKEHKATQACAHCHGSPHAREAVKADGPCGACHGTAHDLGGNASKTSAAKETR